MGNYEELKAAVVSVIKTNGNPKKRRPHLRSIDRFSPT